MKRHTCSTTRTAPVLAAMALAFTVAPAACAQTSAPLATPGSATSMHPNSIQPETTLSVNAEGQVLVDPDIAFLTTGVETEGATARDAMAANRDAMNGVFSVLREAGVEDRDKQTSNFQIYPLYDFIEVEDGNTRMDRRELRGYTVSNTLTVKVRDLDGLGPTLDALVNAGGNTFNGLRFALEDDAQARDEARRAAVRSALERAELLASAAGYRVGRIVTMTEQSYNSGPQPLAALARVESADVAATPIAAGEVGYTANVSILFELVRG